MAVMFSCLQAVKRGYIRCESQSIKVFQLHLGLCNLMTQCTLYSGIKASYALRYILPQEHPSMHHQCPGCSKLFRRKLAGGQCQPCLESVAGPRSDWTLCTGCGNLYPFLEKTAVECGQCLHGVLYRIGAL